MKRDRHSKAQWNEWRKTLRRLTWLANCNSDAELNDFVEKNPRYNWPGEVTAKVRDDVRRLWRGKAVDELATFLLIDQPFLRFATNVRMHFVEKAKMVAKSPASVNWKLRELIYIPQNDFERDVYALLKCSHLAAICEHGEKCKSGEPYFIINKNDRYCSEECAQAARRETWKRNWANRQAKKQKSRKRKRG